MGTVFGKQSVAEPAFEVVWTQTAGLPYEIRRYGTRFAAQVQYAPDGDKNDGTPFRLLARYIGVFGTPENQGETAISMTAPVVKQQTSEQKEGTPIAMTAPVVKSTATTGKDERIMQFILPAEYTSIGQIPKPTNPAVTIETLPPAMGAIHRYSGSFDDDKANEMAQSLAKQLSTDGVTVGDESWVTEHHQFWGYNPPFTLPMFRRNEVWLPLTREQVEKLTNSFNTKSAN
eukprot:scaffold1332_cov166-Amphora_coffeaeformis.AAC.18